MATFEAQVEGLTSLSIDGSSAPTQTELTQFLSDGAMEVINAMPLRLKMFCATEDSFTSTAVGSEAETLDSARVLSVTRRDGSSVEQPCREIPASLRGKASDSDEMIAATVSDPVYYIYNGKLNALPASGACKYLEVNNPTVAYSDSAISNFPDEYEYLVPLYASIKSLQNVLGSRSANSDITTALTAINTELDETQAICDSINTNVDNAVTQISEAATQVDASIDTALAAMATAAGRINPAVVLASNEFDKSDALLTLGETDSEGDINTALGLLKAAVDDAETAADKFESADSESVFGDESTFLTNDSQLARVKEAIDAASSVINSNSPSATTDAFGAQENEDVELVSSALNIAQTEISRAQVHLQEWGAIGDMRVKQINSLLSEADGYAKEIQARLAQSKTKIEASQARINFGNAYLREANSAAQEVSAYASEVNARIAQVGGYSTVISANLNAAQGYANEIQAKIGIAQAYSSEVQTRLAVDNSQYSFYEKQQLKLQADYDKGIQAMRAS